MVVTTLIMIGNTSTVHEKAVVVTNVEDVARSVIKDGYIGFMSSIMSNKHTVIIYHPLDKMY